MKKTAIIIITILLIVLVSIVAGFAFFKDESGRDYPRDTVNPYADTIVYAENGLELTLSEDGSYYCVSDIGKCTDTDIVIPSHHGGIPIEEIGILAFYTQSDIVTVSIPDTVRSIGDGAFTKCEKLRFNLYENGSYLGNSENPYAFLIRYDTPYVADAVIHENTTVLADQAFEKSTLTSVSIPEGVTVIGNFAFRYCKSLKKVEIPVSVHTLGSSAFWGCSALEEAIIGDGITDIKSQTFYQCSSLKNIRFPDGLRNIGYEAFSKCRVLEVIDLPLSLESIGEDAFANCSSLKSITLHRGIETIFPDAFKNVSSFNQKDSVNYLGNEEEPYLYAISVSDTDENEIILQKGTYGIACKFLSGASPERFGIEGGEGDYLRSAGNCIVRKEDGKLICGSSADNIPSELSVSSIGDYAFFAAAGSTHVTVPESVAEIGEYAFSESPSLESVVFLGEDVKLGNRAFYKCKNLTSVILPGGLKEIPIGCFSSCNTLSKIRIPESVDFIGYMAFNSCDSLPEIELKGVKVIEYMAFSDCKSLEKVEFSNSLEHIGNSAFSSCEALRSFSLPKSIIHVGDQAFSGTSIEEFVPPDFVLDFTSTAFSNCGDLVAAKYPEGVTALKAHSLEGCKSLKELHLPSTLESISFCALMYCSSLERIYFNGTLAEWFAIEKGERWYVMTPAFTLICRDGKYQYPENNDQPNY
ncbi:MAG: leucine-rich repeat protein [Clostridia bacterium]|nr:leucine-rich repeat protein [Clostridia bacterium]